MSNEKVKAGVEIHQQLDVGKLFCECPSDLRSDTPDVIVKRRQYAVAGESGKVDTAAAYEESKKRTYVYEGYSDTTCEVEFDESPPRRLNPEALRVGLEISLLLNAKPLSVTQVMRKTVVDGSNTSGFQRTVLIATDGYIIVNKKKIRIYSINLEEDSARRVSETKNSVNFRLDRLGIPLVEITTDPDMTSSEEIKEAVLKIGEILRATRVKRGIGTIRQDVNISIPKGDRTELKGVQDPSIISKIVDFEVNRQLELIKKKQKVEKTVRNVKPDGSNKFLRPMPGAARLYPETDLPLIRISDQFVKEIRSKLPKLLKEITSKLKKRGVNEQYASMLVKERKVDNFKQLLKSKVDANLIAKSLVLFPKEIAGKEGLSLEGVCNRLNNEILLKVFSYVKSKKVSESAVKQVLTSYVKEKNLEKAIKAAGNIKKASGAVEAEVKKLLNSKKGLSQGAYMGILMEQFKGKVEPRELAQIISKLLK